MFEHQTTVLGLAVEVEVSYHFDVDERGRFVELDEIWILGYYPEGLESPAAQRNEYVPMMVKCDISSLTKAEHCHLIDLCVADDIAQFEIAQERAAERAYEARYE